jgi:Icc-related predicted phosphoesterase
MRRTHNELAESDVAHRLKKIESHLSHNSFFVTHCPPKGVFDLRANGIADGSSSLLDLIKNRQPAFHVFGHVHDEFGEKQVGNTRCCNVSSLWTEWILRGYIIDTDKKTVKKVEHRISFEELKVMLEKNKKMNY